MLNTGDALTLHFSESYIIQSSYIQQAVCGGSVIYGTTVWKYGVNTRNYLTGETIEV